MSKKELLEAQDWEALSAKLTAFAWRRLGQRKDKWEDARDIAHDAITRAYQTSGGWDPDKEPLLKYLYLRIKSDASNSLSRARNHFEVSMLLVPEAYEVPNDDDETAEAALDRKRYGEMFRERLERAVGNDEIMAAVLEQWLDGVDTCEEQSKRSGFTQAQITEARRRVFYHAKKIAKELAKELDEDDLMAEEEEVSQ